MRCPVENDQKEAGERESEKGGNVGWQKMKGKKRAA